MVAVYTLMKEIKNITRIMTSISNVVHKEFTWISQTNGSDKVIITLVKKVRSRVDAVS